MAVLAECPPRDADGTPFTKVLQKILIKRGVQYLEMDTGFLAGFLCGLKLANVI